MQIDAIVGEYGLVVITREGSNPNKFIYDSDILSKYMVIVLSTIVIYLLHQPNILIINFYTAQYIYSNWMDSKWS